MAASALVMHGHGPGAHAHAHAHAHATGIPRGVSFAPASSVAVASSATQKDESSDKTTLAPFLAKLRHLVTTCPAEVGRWSDDGTRFEVLRAHEFGDLVCDEFAKGARDKQRTAMKTFVRQLQFYAFRKSSSSAGPGQGPWVFWHPNFVRDDLARQLLVKRYPRASLRDEQEQVSEPETMPEPDPDVIIDDLRRKVASLELTVKELKDKLAQAEAVAAMAVAAATATAASAASNARLPGGIVVGAVPQSPLSAGDDSFYDGVQEMDLVMDEAASLGSLPDADTALALDEVGAAEDGNGDDHGHGHDGDDSDGEEVAHTPASAAAAAAAAGPTGAPVAAVASYLLQHGATTLSPLRSVSLSRGLSLTLGGGSLMGFEDGPANVDVF